jgi:uncharacterized ubiquitin-like protein YukD
MEMVDVNLILRTADKTRKADISLPRTNSGGDVIQAAVDNWSLPTDTEYTLVNVTSGKTLLPSAALTENSVNDGDILEVQPVLVAGDE